jgi:mannose-6-phosphate isomerase-like protein (cupin superfamily)
MPILKDSSVKPKEISPGVFRKLIHLNDLMTAIIDFKNGPWENPEPRHSHPHEQTSYVAKGRLIVYIGEEEFELEEGDVFCVPSDVPHTVKILTKEVRLIDNFNPIREDFIK